jgi:DNA repair exonuclease SbcCD ATPase subunit
MSVNVHEDPYGFYHTRECTPALFLKYFLDSYKARQVRSYELAAIISEMALWLTRTKEDNELWIKLMDLRIRNEQIIANFAGISKCTDPNQFDAWWQNITTNEFRASFYEVYMILDLFRVVDDAKNKVHGKRVMLINDLVRLYVSKQKALSETDVQTMLNALSEKLTKNVNDVSLKVTNHLAADSTRIEQDRRIIVDHVEALETNMKAIQDKVKGLQEAQEMPTPGVPQLDGVYADQIRALQGNVNGLSERMANVEIIQDQEHESIQTIHEQVSQLGIRIHEVDTTLQTSTHGLSDRLEAHNVRLHPLENMQTNVMDHDQRLEAQSRRLDVAFHRIKEVSAIVETTNTQVSRANTNEHHMDVVREIEKVSNRLEKLNEYMSSCKEFDEKQAKLDQIQTDYVNESRRAEEAMQKIQCELTERLEKLEKANVVLTEDQFVKKYQELPSNGDSSSSSELKATIVACKDSIEELEDEMHLLCPTGMEDFIFKLKEFENKLDDVYTTRGTGITSLANEKFFTLETKLAKKIQETKEGLHKLEHQLSSTRADLEKQIEEKIPTTVTTGVATRAQLKKKQQQEQLAESLKKRVKVDDVEE